MENFIIVLVTTSSKQEAEKIAQQLLEDKLIACVNIVDSVSSYFHWGGKIDHAAECLMLIKTRADMFKVLAEKVTALHSYDVPEILALPILKGSKAYLDWLDTVLK